MISKFRGMKKSSRGFIAALMALVLLAGLAVPAFLLAQAADEPLPAYKNVNLSYQERAADLVSRMTLKEKQAQMKPPAPGILRLGLPSYRYQNEALHGIMGAQGTSFPSPLGMAQSWNPEMVEEIGAVVSTEIRAYYNNTIGAGLSYYSPTMNLLRDPRWGRNEEAYSEDTLITAVFGEMYARGLQGIGDGATNQNADSKEFGYDYIKIMPTLKHYAANNGEGNRNRSNSNLGDDPATSNRLLRDYYTWAFQRITEKTGVASLMSAYNRVNEVPCAVNKYLLTTLLRQTFGFDGFVVNDCAAMLTVTQPVSSGHHQWNPAGKTISGNMEENKREGYVDAHRPRYDMVVRPGNNPITASNYNAVYYDEGTAFGVMAGNNMDCGGGGPIDWVYDKYTVMAVERGLVSEDWIDHNLYEIILTRFRSGEFDDPAALSGSVGNNSLPYKGDDYRWNSTREKAAHQALAIEAGVQAGVLLKNDNSALPIGSSVSKVSVFGPLANYVDLGDYSGSPQNRTTFVQGMTKVGNRNGLNFTVANGRLSFTNGLTGSSWPYVENGNHSFNVDTTAINGAIAANGVSVVYVGTRSHFENGRDSIYGAFLVCQEGRDRSNIVLPGKQIDLINAVVAATKEKGGKTVVVMQAVGPMDVSGFINNVDALLYTAYNGQHQGESHAKLLFGEANPGGHLTQTWYKNDGQLYSNTTTNVLVKDAGSGQYVNQSRSPFLDDYTLDTNGGKKGRTYMFYEGYKAGATEAQKYQYPFGYGLSYTTFDTTFVSAVKNAAAGTVDVTVKVKNTGTRAGADVVQVYVKAPGAGTGVNPMQQLKGFKRVELNPDEEKTVVIPVELKDLAVIDTSDTVDLSTKTPDIKTGEPALYPGDVDEGAAKHGRRKIMPGDYEFIVATDSTRPVHNGAKVALTAADYALKLKVVTLRTDKIAAIAGETFDSHVTVCLTDESFLQPGAAGLTVSYSSDNQAVATVNASTGKVTAVAPGTALIKASFTYAGETKEVTYPIVVVGTAFVESLNIEFTDAIAGNIKTALPHVRYNRSAYDFEVPVSTTSIPEVTWTADSKYTVKVTNPTVLPGKARLEITGDGAESAVIEINYKYPPYEGGNAVVGTWPDDGPMGSNIGSSMYSDWKSTDDVAKLKLASNSNIEHLYLTFDLVFEHTNPNDLPINDLENALKSLSGYVKLRSSDQANKPGDQYGGGNDEHNFGWRIRSDWGLILGVNHVEIPLYDSITNSSRTGREGDVYRQDYKILVNGEPVSAVEMGRGLINWDDVYRRILVTEISNQMYRPGLSMEIRNLRVEDRYLDAFETPLARDALVEYMEEGKIPQGSYSKYRYDAYTKAWDDAEKILEISNWVAPFKWALANLEDKEEKLSKPDPYPIPMGDIDESGKVDITDARLLLQHLVDKIHLSIRQIEIGAVNGAEDMWGDPTVSITDARLILQYLVEKITEFPCGKEFYSLGEE